MNSTFEQEGKTEQFRRVFESKSGISWIKSRKASIFYRNHIIPTLMEVMDMSEEDAKICLSDKVSINFSISQLVDDIKDYLNTKPKNFRLLFMADEVGQYVGTDTNMLLNLQSIVEKSAVNVVVKYGLYVLDRKLLMRLLKFVLMSFHEFKLVLKPV